MNSGHRIFLFLLLGAVLSAALPAISWAAHNFTLTMAPANITFPDQDPDTNPTTAATQTVTITVSATGMGSDQWSLTALSRGNMVAPGSSIPISNISWTATNQPTFMNGSMTTAAPGTLVARRSGNGSTSGILTFAIQNLWTYFTGNYTQTTDFTVASP